MSPSLRSRLLRKILKRIVMDADEPLERRRAALDRLDKLPRPRRVDYEDTTLGGVPAIVATPADGERPRHILYLHGGGYTIGSPKSHVAFCARLARAADAVITVIDYRLAPEHAYPAAVEDCVAAYRALADRVDPARIAIAGDSAGGGAALATLCALRDAGDPLPSCAYLLSPWTDLTVSGESVHTKADIDPMIVASAIGEAASLYAADTPLDDPGLSPLFADLAGLPPLLIQTGIDEVLLSDSTRLADRARAADVYAELDLAEHMWHVYPMLAGFMPEADDAVTHAARFLKAHTSPGDTTSAAPAR